MKKIDWTKPLRYVGTKEPAHYEGQLGGYHRVWGRKGTYSNNCDCHNDYGSHDYYPIENVPDDQELADKYRELRAEACEVAEQLISKGYTAQYRLEDGVTWNNLSRPNNGVNYRFRKIRTKTVETIL